MVVVVGASSGIGRATAHALARRGDRLVLASRSAEVLAEVVAECRELHAGAPEHDARVIAVPTDVTDRDAVDDLLDTTQVTFGRIDAVVHTPAVVVYGRGVHDGIPAGVWGQTIRVNLFGTVNVARAALHRFRAHGGGHLVLFGSLLGTVAAPWMSPYVTSRWAVHGLARSLQMEVRGIPGIEVSLVEPTAASTPRSTRGRRATRGGWAAPRCPSTGPSGWPTPSSEYSTARAGCGRSVRRTRSGWCSFAAFRRSTTG